MFGDIGALVHSSIFYEFAVLLALAALAGFAAALLRQPLVIAFMVTGVLAGPSVFGIVQSGDEITLLAKLGIAILLFIVGLKLDMKLIKGLGLVSAIIGLAQIFLTVGLGMGLCLWLGYDLQVSFLIGIALAFSSTIIIVKILSDRREIDSAHGRLALGVLIIQDLAVVLSMIVLATVGGSMGESVQNGLEGAQDEGGLMMALLQVAGSSVLLIFCLGLFMRFGAVRLMSFTARSPELLLIFSIAWAVMLAALCDMLGLSKELGGLLAGVSLASTPFREAIISRLSSLRDFLLLFFFIALGIQLDLSLMSGAFYPVLALCVFVMVFKSLVIMVLAGVLGYRKRTGFMAGVSLAQISEFSLIFITMAYSLDLVGGDVLGLVTMVALITITISTYVLSMSNQLYQLAEPFLGIFERRQVHREQEYDSGKPRQDFDVIVFGLGRYGQAMAEGFIAKGKHVLAVDFNPEAVKEWKSAGGYAVYGDACDAEFFHTLPLKTVRWVVSALPKHQGGVTHEDPRLMIFHGLRDNHYTGKTAVACHRDKSAEAFEALGADLVLRPFHDAADRAVNMVLEREGDQPKR